MIDLKMFWLSFVDTGTDTFLGGCLVKAEDAKAAVTKSHALGINPGGEVCMVQADAQGAFPLDTLLQKEEIIALDEQSMRGEFVVYEYGRSDHDQA